MTLIFFYFFQFNPKKLFEILIFQYITQAFLWCVFVRRRVGHWNRECPRYVTRHTPFGDVIEENTS